MEFALRQFGEHDIDTIITCFAAAGWPKPRSTFEIYLEEQKTERRVIWVAYHEEQFAGYVTLSWESRYEPFHQDDIPEIMDLNVLPAFRYNGIGSALLQAAETTAFNRCEVVGLGVGLYPDYGAAQKLYIQRGYVPDGLGITYRYKQVQAGNTVILGDDLVLWFVKEKNNNKRH